MLDRVTAFDAVVLLLLLHLVAMAVAVFLSAETGSKSTRLWRYLDRRIFSAVFAIVMLVYWAVVAIGPAASYLAFIRANFLRLLIGVGLVSYGLSNGRLLAEVLKPRLRDDHPIDGDTVAVSGTASPVEGTGETPFGGVEALCSHATVEAYEEGWGNMTNWYQHDERIESRRFAIDGPRGELVVDPAEANWRVPRTYGRTYDADEPGPEPVVSGLETHPDLDAPDSPKVAFSIEKHRVVERALEPGREVLVVGELSVEDDAPVVQGGDPFVLTQGDSSLAYAGMVAWTVAGNGLGLWLLVDVFGPFVTLGGPL